MALGLSEPSPGRTVGDGAAADPPFPVPIKQIETAASPVAPQQSQRKRRAMNRVTLQPPLPLIADAFIKKPSRRGRVPQARVPRNRLQTVRRRSDQCSPTIRNELKALSFIGLLTIKPFPVIRARGTVGTPLRQDGLSPRTFARVLATRGRFFDLWRRLRRRSHVRRRGWSAATTSPAVWRCPRRKHRGRRHRVVRTQARTNGRRGGGLGRCGPCSARPRRHDGDGEPGCDAAKPLETLLASPGGSRSAVTAHRKSSNKDAACSCGFWLGQEPRTNAAPRAIIPPSSTPSCFSFRRRRYFAHSNSSKKMFGESWMKGALQCRQIPTTP